MGKPAADMKPEDPLHCTVCKTEGQRCYITRRAPLKHPSKSNAVSLTYLRGKCLYQIKRGKRFLLWTKTGIVNRWIGRQIPKKAQPPLCFSSRLLNVFSIRYRINDDLNSVLRLSSFISRRPTAVHRPDQFFLIGVEKPCYASDGFKESITNSLISTPALTHLNQFLTYCPMRLTVAPCS